MLSLSGILYSQNFGLQLTDNPKYTTIPFTYFNNLIIIPVSINNSDSLNFIVDTGVKNTILLDSTIAHKLGLEYIHQINIHGAASSQIVVGNIVSQVNLATVGLKGNIHSLVVIEDDYLKLENYFGKKIHGIIGYDLFRHLIVKINYEQKELKVYNPESFKLPRRYSKLNFELENGKPYINALVSVDDTTKVHSRLMIDLGASHSALFELHSEDSIKLPEKYLCSSLGRGLGGRIDGYKARINSISIEGFRFEDVIVSYSDSEEHLTVRNRVKRTGTLGGEILSRFHIVFDYLDQSMYLKKNRKYRQSFEHNLCGITIKTFELGFTVFLVDEVIKDSPADEAGIKTGDYLIDINGIPAYELSYDEITGIFHSRPNRKIRLTVNRNCQDINIKLRLRRMI